ncbi:long-chain fatty acid--CoA ligase [Labilibaculum sp. DW002]|uniref:Long-chain fatty acid--CoA ligase n=1 Tax=Paralabilibaculum antarcticum TaxID=2912572 RepID=A0ABT5VUB1_9BACT|nr:long-chain fatty acid--CoA ligase [Labilibaculum sp. DW002]MDE5419005.1 long-chain fatty acid--CoA ligase [Labilibaculum sp. DW002]
MEYQHWGKLIRNRIEKYTDGIAMHYKDEKSGEWVGVSWTEFGLQIRQISKALIKVGVGEKQMAAIFSQNMPEWITADLAIMCLRGVTVPIYPTNSAKEAEYIVEDSQAQVIFVGEQEQYDRTMEFIDRVPHVKMVVAFDKDVVLSDFDRSMHWDEFLIFGKNSKMGPEFEDRFERAELDDLATLIYTSGTTGEPKGVMIDHNNITSVLRSHDIELDLTDDEVSLSFLPLSHVYERGWTFFCLHRGFKIYFNRDPKQIGPTMKEARPTIMCTVPRIYEKIYSAIQDKSKSASPLKQKLINWAIQTGGKYNNDYQLIEKKIPLGLKLKFKLADKLVLSKFRDIFGGRINFTPCGGAPLSSEIIAFFHSVGINVKMGYGLTETMATVCLYGDTHIDFNTTGKTLNGVEIKIGANDEIMVKGPGVMRGYYKKPEETAKVMKDGWFCTGDAGKIDENGNLTITDRIKDLMKTSGGKYVAPQKLETTLVNDQFIEQVAVIGDCKKYVTALAVPAFEPLAQYAKKHNISFESIEDLIANSQIVEFFEKRFEDMQKEFSRFEKIKKFTLLPKEFSMEAGEITSTLKLKRKVIQEKYKHLIEKMYKD